MKKKLIAIGILVEATAVLAYHGTGRGAPETAGTPLSGWVLLLLLAVMCLVLYLGWRWWKNLNKSAFRN